MNTWDAKIVDHSWVTADYPTANDQSYAYLNDMIFPVLYKSKFYYASLSADYALYSSNLDGTQIGQLSAQRAPYLTIHNDTIYFSNYSHNGWLYSINTSGSNLTQINDIQVANLYVHDGWLYYNDDDSNTATSSNLYCLCIDQTYQPAISMDGVPATGVSPILHENNIMLPLSQLETLMGFTSVLANDQITITYQEKTLQLTRDSTETVFNNEIGPTLTAAPLYINQELMIPIAQVGRILGFQNYSDNWHIMFVSPDNEILKDATLSNLLYNNIQVSGFQQSVHEYNVELPFGTAQSPTITAYKNQRLAGDPVITQASSLPGTATVTVTSADGLIQQNYTINFTVASEPTTDECFIATAAFGSKFTWPVALLRAFRDQYLLTNPAGRAFVDFYYHNSPPIASFIAGSEPLKGLVRVLLAPVIATVYMIYHPALLLIFLILLTTTGYIFRMLFVA